ncbi:hypothetical protein Hanom_Chr01g00073591 [Helianthus anomalus]
MSCCVVVFCSDHYTCASYRINATCNRRHRVLKKFYRSLQNIFQNQIYLTF